MFDFFSLIFGLLIVFPFFSPLFFILELQFNPIVLFILFILFIILYSISLLSMIIFIILKIVNIKYKSDKIKRINKKLFIFLYVLIITYISSIAMEYISKYWELERIKKLEMEQIEDGIYWYEDEYND